MAESIVRRRILACLVLPFVSMFASGQEMLLAEAHPPGHPIVQIEESFKTQLAERTKGAIRIQVKHSGELGNESKAWEKVRSGDIALARINLATVINEVPAVKLLSLPFLFRSREHMWSVLAGSFGKRVASELDKSGAVILAYYDSGSRSFYTSKKPIRSRSDFMGMRIRIQPSPVYKDLISALGAMPVILPYDKVLEAFQNGEIDGAENNSTSYYSAGHYKYAKYYCMDEHSSVPEVLLMSKKAWNSLKEDQKEIVKSIATESSAQMKKLWAESELQSLEKAKKEGAIVVEKSHIAMAGITSFATRLYSKYVTDLDDLELVLAIQNTK